MHAGPCALARGLLGRPRPLTDTELRQTPPYALLIDLGLHQPSQVSQRLLPTEVARPASHYPELTRLVSLRLMLPRFAVAGATALLTVPLAVINASTLVGADELNA